MRFEFDQSANALYVRLVEADAFVARTLEIDPGTLVDLDERGSVLGIEVIRPARAWPLEAIISQCHVTDEDVQRLRFFFGPTAKLKTFPFTRDNDAMVGV